MEIFWKDAVVVQSDVLSRQLSGEHEENNKNSVTLANL
jgi:hypothetical protein